MKKTKRLLLLPLAALLLLSGCGKGKKEENHYTVYYVNPAGTRLEESRYVPGAQTFEELMTELLGQMEQPPSGYESALQGTVKILGYERGIDALRIDFSKEYYELGNTDEVLLRAAVVKTFSQIPGASKVMITVEQEQLRDADGQLVPAMDAESFIAAKDGGINSYLFSMLTLYFPDASGRKLVQESRSVHYSSNKMLERVVIEQLIAGAKQSGKKALFTDAVKIQSISVKDGICTIRFDQEVNKTPAESSVTPEAAIYAVVNSICETCSGITGVRLEIEGDSTVKFRDAVNLDQEFSMNYDYIAAAERMTESGPSVMADGSDVSASEQDGNASEQPGGTVQDTETIPTGNSVIGVDPELAVTGDSTEG